MYICVTAGKDLIKEKMCLDGMARLRQFSLLLAKFTCSDFVNISNMSLCILKTIHRDATVRLQDDAALREIASIQSLEPSLLAMDFVVLCLS